MGCSASALLKVAASAPFRSSVRAEQQRAVPGSTATDGAPGSGMSVRSGAPSSRSTGTRPRDESAPPTKPSIAPPSGSALRTPERPLLSESPLSPFRQPTPRLSHRLVLVLAGAALGFGGLLAVTQDHDSASALSSLPWLLAASTLIFSLSMAVVITLTFARRLDALAKAARKVASGRGHAEVDPDASDAIASLAGSLTRLTERIAELTAERERSSEQEQGRLDALVRERTREVAEENEDLRRVLGDSKGVLSVDAQGKVVGQLSSQLLPKWLGAAPHHVLFWDYFEQASPGAGARFQAAWSELSSTTGELDVRRLPRTLAVGERYFSVEYRPVRDANGGLRRMLVVLTDITIPEPDPATPL